MNSPRPSSSDSDAFAVRAYRIGLRLYPPAHRRRFGPEMEQVFRDQWRDMRATGSLLGRVVLGLRTVTDLLVTASRERWAGVREALVHGTALSSRARLGWSLGAGLPVALIVLGAAVAVTLAMPVTYRSEARINVPRVAGEEVPSPTAWNAQGSSRGDRRMDMAIPDEALARVVEALSLQERWGREYLREGVLQTPEAVALLRDRISVQRIRLTQLYSIAAYDADPQRAADIANALTQAYVSSLRRAPSQSGSSAGNAGVAPGIRVSIVDEALPALRPMRPNVPLNLILGLMMGAGAGLVSAAVVWLLLRRRSFSPPLASPP